MLARPARDEKTLQKIQRWSSHGPGRARKRKGDEKEKDGLFQFRLKNDLQTRKSRGLLTREAVEPLLC